MKLTNFIGNEKIVEHFASLLESAHFPHLIIITGESGLGKKTLARDLAAALVCRSDNKPCGQCSQCRKAMQNIHPDIIEYIPSGSAKSFSVDTVREVINSAYMSPNEAQYKIYILADAHCMSEQAQNALLKILEEPPSYAVFIMTATSKNDMLETVLSRSVTVTLEGVGIAEGSKYICAHHSDIELSQAQSTLELFNGNIGRAVESLKDDKTALLVNVCCDICKALVKGNEYSMIISCSALQPDRQSVVFVCELLKKIFRDALAGGGNCEFISGQKETALLLREHLSAKKLTALVGVCSQLKNSALTNVNNALIITQIPAVLMQAAGR